MADSFGPDYLARSMFFREAEGQPTNQEVQGMSSPFQGSPEQAMAFLQSPGAQQMLQHFGLSGFDPSQIRQSPFLPNSLMQAHPMLGHMLSNAMSNVASTPAAPLVSGAGSGMSRAMQGIMGGNEMQRQYQVRQLMAPFQAMGMQMPAMAEQRRQELLQALEQDMQNRQKMEQQYAPVQLQARTDAAQAAEMRAAAERERAAAEQERANKSETKFGPYGRSVTTPTPGVPAGGPEGANFQQLPPYMAGSRQMTNMAPGPSAQQGQQFNVPGTGLTPAVSPGSKEEYIPYTSENVGDVHPERQAQAGYKQALIDAGMPDAEAEEKASKAFESRARGNEANAKASQGGTAGAGQKWTPKNASELEDKKATEKNKLFKEYATTREKYKNDQEWQSKDPNSYNNFMSRLQELEDQYTEAGRALGGTYSGYTYPGMRSSVPAPNPFLSPNAASAPKASPGSAQTGGPGSQTNQNVAPASGLPPGYSFNEQGIPVKSAPAPQQ